MYVIRFTEDFEATEAGYTSIKEALQSFRILYPCAVAYGDIHYCYVWATECEDAQEGNAETAIGSIEPDLSDRRIVAIATDALARNDLAIVKQCLEALSGNRDARYDVVYDMITIGGKQHDHTLNSR